MDNTNERLTRVEESTKSAHKRLDEMDSEIKDLRSLTIAVHNIASSVKSINEKIDGINSKLDKQDERVAIIENKPAKRVDSAVDAIIKWVAVAAIVYIATKLGVGG